MRQISNATAPYVNSLLNLDGGKAAPGQAESLSADAMCVEHGIQQVLK